MCYRRFEAMFLLTGVAKNITGDCVTHYNDGRKTKQILKIVSCENLAIFPNVSVTCKTKIHSGVPGHSNFEFSVH